MTVVIEDMAAFDKFLAEAGDNAVIIDFYADWCGPCKQIAPRFKELAEMYTNIKTCKVNVDDNEEVAGRCEVQAMPTFVVFRNSKKVDKLVGASQPKLEELFQKYN